MADLDMTRVARAVARAMAMRQGCDAAAVHEVGCLSERLSAQGVPAPVIRARTLTLALRLRALRQAGPGPEAA